MLLPRLAFYVILMTWCFSWADSSIRIDFLATAVVAPGKILLKDIAHIEGEPAMVQRLSTLEVGSVDVPGRSTRLSVSAIRMYHLRGAGLEKNLLITGAKHVRVTAASVSVTKDSVLALLRQQLSMQLAGQDWSLEADRMPSQFVIPSDPCQLEVVLPVRFNARGQQTASLEAIQNGKTIVRHRISFVVRRWTNLAQATKKIEKGAMVNESDLEMVRSEITYQQRRVVDAASEVVGRTATRDIRKGDLIVEHWLEKPYDIRHGESMQLESKVGGILVRTTVRSRQNGFVGQVIEVESMEGSKIMQARVTNPGKAQVLN